MLFYSLIGLIIFPMVCSRKLNFNDLTLEAKCRIIGLLSPVDAEKFVEATKCMHLEDTVLIPVDQEKFIGFNSLNNDKNHAGDMKQVKQYRKLIATKCIKRK